MLILLTIAGVTWRIQLPVPAMSPATPLSATWTPTTVGLPALAVSKKYTALPLWPGFVSQECVTAIEYPPSLLLL